MVKTTLKSMSTNWLVRVEAKLEMNSEDQKVEQNVAPMV
jgi:hypothetical protein